MSGAEGIIIAFRSFQETAQAPELADGMHPVFSAGQNFMRVGLMTHIPDKFIVRCIENIMKRYRQFNGAEAGSEMPSAFRYAIDQVFPHFIAHRTQILFF